MATFEWKGEAMGQFYFWGFRDFSKDSSSSGHGGVKYLPYPMPGNIRYLEGPPPGGKDALPFNCLSSII